MSIDIVHELGEAGVDHVIKDGYAEVKCPFHADSNPSGSLSIEHGGFKCFACGVTSDFAKFLAAVLGKEPNLIRVHLESRYGVDDDKIIDIALVERYHKDIEDQTWLRAQLAKRCVPPEVIKERRLGAANGRIIIPVYNKAGSVVNLRKYRPGGEQKSKMINQRGHAKPPRLYPIDQLKYPKIALCGGEVKALAAAHVLNQIGIGAISSTCGESNWSPQLSLEFKDKVVYVIYDIDDAGIKGAQNVAAQLHPIAREVFVVKLELDADKYPNGDVNDFLAEGGDLPVALELTEPWTPPHKRHLLNGATTKVHVSACVNAEYTSKRVNTECVIVAIGQQPYVVPSKVIVNCGKDQDVCGVCKVMHDPQGTEYELQNEDPMILGMVDATDKAQVECLKIALDIPLKCRSCAFTPTEHFHVEDVRISPKLEISNREVQRELIPAYVLQHSLVLNETYSVTGRMHPHPQTQAATLLVSESKISDDALSLYDNKDPHELNVFKPKEWTVDSIKSKLKELYNDLAANVTGIYGRQDMHLVMDLSYHSPLFIDAFSKPNQHARKKGWVETLILGDSSQGKTEAALGLMNHYRLGEKVDCKNATVAGVLGGLQQMGKKWFVSWGIIPTHDKRLVVLEELKGMHPEVFSKLTDMRSSGEAQIPKIEKRRTHARTRLIALSNPVGSRTMGTYACGVEAVGQLIPNPEDVRRFDLALIVSSEEVPDEVKQRALSERSAVNHFYTSDLCQRLVLWAWTVDKVQFEDEDYIVQQAIELQKEFHHSLQLIDSGSTHMKIARLAAALAARTYSTDDYKTLVVRKCHVDYIVGFIRKIYSAPNCRYDIVSEGRREKTVLKASTEVKELLNHLPNPLGFSIELTSSRGVFDQHDLAVWSGLDPSTVRTLLHRMTMLKAITRMSGAGVRYVATPGLLKLLEEMKEKKEFVVPPTYEQEDF